MKLIYRKNGSPNIALIGGLGVAAFLAYEWFKNQSSVVAMTPITSNTTVNAVSSGTSANNPFNKYIISQADLQAIYNIAVNQLGVTGKASFSYWAKAFYYYKGFELAVSYPDDSIQLTAAEFANFVNNWAQSNGLSGLGVIGQNFGPPTNNIAAGYFPLLNAMSRS